MNLVVDIGNSSVKAALFDGACLLSRQRLEGPFADVLVRYCAGHVIDACAYCIVGADKPVYHTVLQGIAPRVLRVTGATPTPLVSLYRTPHTLGADRLAAVVGAASLYAEGALLVVDAGTCITYDYVDEHRRYLGGSISPGLGIRLRALHDQTAALPLVSAAGERPEVGYDTETAIRCGVLGGMEHEVAGTIAAWQTKHPQGTVCLTGGNAYRLAQGLHVQRHDCLVEIGLNYLLLHDTAATEASAHGAL